MLVRDTLLDTLIARHTAFASFAELEPVAKLGYVPTVTTVDARGAIRAEKTTLVTGLVERGLLVWTGK